jgi:hypothetical protein
MAHLAPVEGPATIIITIRNNKDEAGGTHIRDVAIKTNRDKKRNQS